MKSGLINKFSFFLLMEIIMLKVKCQWKIPWDYFLLESGNRNEYLKI